MVSLYSLQNLYNQGILDYVPAELASTQNVSSLTGMQNPYLNMAAQGNLFQTAGMNPDSFSYSGTNLGFQDGTAGHLNAGYVGGSYNNGFANAGLNALGGINGSIGMNNSQAGMNGFGGVSGNILTNNSPAGRNGFGGGFGKLGQTVANTPNIIKGLIAGGIIIGTTMLCLKKGKKAPVKVQSQNTSFLSKLKFWKK